MFFCDPCATKNKWPNSFHKSAGRCEVCGKASVCNDMPSSHLPVPILTDEQKARIAAEVAKTR